VARQMVAFYFMREGYRILARAGWQPTPTDWVGHKNMALAALVDEMPTDPFIPERGVVLRAEELPTFRCVKVNGGEIVAEFDSREEALALMLKHAKQRKAKLQVLNSNTGELELFSEEEAVI